MWILWVPRTKISFVDCASAHGFKELVRAVFSTWGMSQCCSAILLNKSMEIWHRLSQHAHMEPALTWESIPRFENGFGQFAKKAGVLPMGLCTCRAPRIPMVYHHIFHDMRSFCKVAFFGQTRLDLLMLTPRSSRRNPITWDASVFASYTLYY
jgi:hypothetical protein